jgi:hypothetical protein
VLREAARIDGAVKHRVVLLDDGRRELLHRHRGRGRRTKDACDALKDGHARTLRPQRAEVQTCEPSPEALMRHKDTFAALLELALLIALLVVFTLTLVYLLAGIVEPQPMDW